MRIAYNNFSDRNTILSSSTAITNYPVTNLQDNRLSQTYRTATLTNAYIIVDLGTYSTVATVIALINHNLTSSAVVTIDYNSINSFPGVTSQTVTYNSNMILKFYNTTDIGHLLTEAGDNLTTETGDYLTTDYQYRYAKVSITDSANPDGYIELGRLWIGDYLTVDPSSLLDFKVTKKRSDYVQYGRNRQKWASPGVGWRKFELNFPPTEETLISELATMYDTIGNYKSLIFCNFDTIRDYVLVEPCYCGINGDFTFNHTERMKFIYSLNLEEDL